MQLRKLCFDGILIIGCLTGGLFVPVPAYCEAPLYEHHPSKFEIYGCVSNMISDFSDQNISRIGESKSSDDFLKLLQDMYTLVPAPHAVITLHGETFTTSTVADSEGNYKFIALSPGHYEISAKMPSEHSAMDSQNIGWRTTRVNLKFDKRVDLQLYSISAVVKGRVVDTQGKPIAHANVRAMRDYPDDLELPSEVIRRLKIWPAISDDDGMFQLHQIYPTDIYPLSGYLYGGSERALNYISIQVSADGFIQREEQIPRVPLVTEEMLDRARLFFRASNQMSTQAGGEELQEKEGLSFPSSIGNTITDIEIVLQPVQIDSLDKVPDQ